MILAIILCAIISTIDASYVISLYGDVRKDTTFFTETFPWIIDNIGGDLSVDYYLLGSGSYSVPQMCVLNELRLNTFLQAQYLQCEASGHPSQECICETGVDLYKILHCIHSGGNLASFANSKYMRLGIDASPIIEVGPKNTVFEVKDDWYLKKICTVFGDNLPRGCVKPFACNATQEAASDRYGLCFMHTGCRCSTWYTPTTLSTPPQTTPRYYTTTSAPAYDIL